jgi:exopolyphosphatase/guanosine-5'-triphosphate,3'-diphosphate pyrophosphatase
VRVIDGLEEARLVYLGARRDIDFSPGRALLFDIGGGSTEFVLCDAEQALVQESLPIGHIRLTEAFVHDDPITDADRRALKTHVQQLLQSLLARVRPGDFASLIGTSGTVRALARVAACARGEPEPEHEHGLVLRRSEIDDLVRTLRTKPSSSWVDLPGMDARRRRTLPAGAIVVREVMKALGADVLVSSERSLRDGLVVDWILKHRPELALSRSTPDPRRRSVLALQSRFGADVAHASKVAELSLALFDGTAALHRRTVDDRRLLEFAALLHDIGHHVDGEDHHRHGQYLIRHARMAGFTAPEIAILGNLVRYHRGNRPKLRHPEFAALVRPDRTRVRVLSALLRFADALDRGHHGRARTIDVRVADDGVHVRVLAEEPFDLERWAAVQRVDALEEELEVRFHVEFERIDARPDAEHPPDHRADPSRVG